MEKVFVALSGGVDSAVAAAILKGAGYDVTGVFIKIWQPEFIECSWKEDRLDTIRVAAALRIPFKEIDFSKLYKKEVISKLIEGYKTGVTPNPDVVCNSHIKFGALWEWAKKNGADKLATGHHAQIKKVENGKYELRRGIDNEKDQSYFLWQLTQKDLSHSLFPVGEITKKEVRNLAKKFNLPVADKPDSQGLCFIGHLDIQQFLKNFINTKPGKVLDVDSNVIGFHEGAQLYTLGQRSGFTVNDKSSHRVPMYIIKTDVTGNTITISDKKQTMAKNFAEITQQNWLSDITDIEKEYSCQTRYRQTPSNCSVVSIDGQLKIIFEELHLSTPGQSLVVYKKNICIGGGVIK
jgi:tRNA-uridine 2-sulfurtransferase